MVRRRLTGWGRVGCCFDRLYSRSRRLWLRRGFRSIECGEMGECYMLTPAGGGLKLRSLPRLEGGEGVWESSVLEAVSVYFASAFARRMRRVG